MQQLSPAKLTSVGCVDHHLQPNLDIYTARDDHRVNQKSNNQSIFNHPRAMNINFGTFVFFQVLFVEQGLTLL